MRISKVWEVIKMAGNLPREKGPQRNKGVARTYRTKKRLDADRRAG